MLKNNEKIIFEMKSGYSLLGLEGYDLSGKCLQITNLGNIFISKVDYLEDNEVDYIGYSFENEQTKLGAEIDRESVNIIAESLNFKMIRENFEMDLKLDLIMVLDLEEIISISSELENNIFEYKNNAIILNNEKRAIVGTIEHNDDKVIFYNINFRFEFNFTDIEYYLPKNDIIYFKGYFHSVHRKDIITKILFLGNGIESKFPKDIFSIVDNNDKIGVLPTEDVVSYCKLSGLIASIGYVDAPALIIRHSDMIVIYDFVSKKELKFCKMSSLMMLGSEGGKYILHDGSEFFSFIIELEDLKKIGLDRLGKIKSKYLGFTKGFMPVVVELNDENILIKSSSNDEGENEIFSIKKSEVSNISVKETNIAGDNYVEAEIRFGDKFIKINLMREFVTEISTEVFSDYQNSIINAVPRKEVYDNWTKSVCDMVVYNFFGHIYDLKRRYSHITESSSLRDMINFTNDLYDDIHFQIENVDFSAVSMFDILFNSEKKYFGSNGFSYDITIMEGLERVFYDIRNDIKIDLIDISSCLENINHFILPEKLRESTVNRINEGQSYQLAYFSRMALSKLNHLIYNLLPSYVSRIVSNIFRIYDTMYDNYSVLSDEELKNEIVARIRNAYIFKQYIIDADSNVIRNDIIEDLYSIVKFSSMKIDSEFYYSGGYR